MSKETIFKTVWSKLMIRRDVRRALAAQKKKDRELDAKIDKWIRSRRWKESGCTVDEIAHSLGVRYEQLYYYFMTYYGLTPKRFLRKLKIEDAKCVMCTSPGISTREAAWLVGISDPANFCAQFEKEENMSVTEWREKYTKYKKKRKDCVAPKEKSQE